MVQDGLGDPREGPGRVGENSDMSGQGQGTLEEVRDVSGDTLKGPGRVGRPF